MEKIYDMKLGERVDFDIWNIWRVPGGWIFALDAGNYGLTQFVPFSRIDLHNNTYEHNPR